MYSIAFKNCHKVFPLRIIRPVNRHKIDNQYHLNEVLEDLALNSTKINNIVCDKPKRCDVCMIMNQNATYACEYCESPAVHIDNEKKIQELTKKSNLKRNNLKAQIESLQTQPGPSSNVKKAEQLQKVLDNADENLRKEIQKLKSKHLCWPCSTSNGNARTMDNINSIVDDMEASDNPLPRHEAKGITGRSLLLNHENFSIIEQVSTEYMHSVCLGCVKRLLQLTFNVGENRLRATKRKRSDPKEFNTLIRLVQVPYEWSRRIRNLDFAVLKAAEFRNIILFFFSIVVKCIEPKYVKERKLWLQLAFVIRACVLSNEEFCNIDSPTISALALNFYKNYEQVYGGNNCTYSIHVVGSHILQIRGDSPLTERSAFIFESFYAEMKNLFCPGTLSPLKQILKNCIVKRQIQPHSCQIPIKYQEMPQGPDTRVGKENNHSIYVLTENQHKMYSIIHDNDDNTFTCVKQGKYVAKFDELKNVYWGQVGVYKLGPLCDQPVTIKKKRYIWKMCNCQ